MNSLERFTDKGKYYAYLAKKEDEYIVDYLCLSPLSKEEYYYYIDCYDIKDFVYMSIINDINGKDTMDLTLKKGNFDSKSYYFDTVCEENGEVRIYSEKYDKKMSGQFLISKPSNNEKYGYIDTYIKLGEGDLSWKSETNYLEDTILYYGLLSAYNSKLNTSKSFSDMIYLLTNVLATSRFPYGGYVSKGEQNETSLISSRLKDNLLVYPVLNSWIKLVESDLITITLINDHSYTAVALTSLMTQAITRVKYYISNMIDENYLFNSILIYDPKKNILGKPELGYDEYYKKIDDAVSIVTPDLESNVMIILSLGVEGLISIFSERKDVLYIPLRLVKAIYEKWYNEEEFIGVVDKYGDVVLNYQFLLSYYLVSEFYGKIISKSEKKAKKAIYHLTKKDISDKNLFKFVKEVECFIKTFSPIIKKIEEYLVTLSDGEFYFRTNKQPQVILGEAIANMPHMGATCWAWFYNNKINPF